MKSSPRYITFVSIIALVLTIPFNLDATEPALHFNISHQQPKQGNTVKVAVQSSIPMTSGSAAFIGKTAKLFPTPGKQDGPYHYTAYIGIPRWTTPKKYPIVLNISLTNGGRYKKTLYTTVNDAHFPVSRINVPKEKKALANNKKQLSNEGRILSTHFKKVSTKKQFSTPFIMPAEGRISSPFGAYRLYSNNQRSSYHSGVDIANREGTPIIAPNNGTVLYSGDLKSHGKTILIDHGWGIISVFIHLNERLVRTGHQVERGDIIAKMGSTGISTGPHVHWGLSIQNVRVNPMQWVNASF